MFLTSKYGQQYQCSFPDNYEAEKQKEEAEKVAMETGIPDLLKPMETSPCLQMTKDWWSYEFCYGKYIRQFHISEEAKIEGEILFLGYYESEYNWEDESEGQTDAEQKRLRRYHTQQYVNGTKCDISGKQRKTEVRFQCEEGNGDHIARVDEPETCVYVMTVHTTKICHHPFLKPPTPQKTVAITCHPLLSVVQYQEYLDEIEAEEERKRLEKEKKKQEAEEKERLAKEKAKYYEESQMENAEDGVEVKEEIDNGEVEMLEPDSQSIFGDDLSDLMKSAKLAGSGDAGPLKFKVINSPEDIKDFLKEAMDEIKNVKVADPVKDTGKVKGQEEEDEDLKSILGDDEDTEELGAELKSIKERYKNRRERLAALKKKVKTSMEQQFDDIFKEAKDELSAEDSDASENWGDKKAAFKQLSSTLEALMQKLDKTEKEISEVDKELEQFVSYDNEDQHKTPKLGNEIPEKQDHKRDLKWVEDEFKRLSAKHDKDGEDINTKETSSEGHNRGLTKDQAKGPDKTSDNDDDDDKIKVRISRIKSGELMKEGEEIRNKQIEDLEKSVQKGLEEAGLGDSAAGGKIQVKIITAGYYDDKDDSLHVLSDKDSEVFRNMIVSIIGGTSEGEREEAKHAQLEENYSFVWGKDKHTNAKTLNVIEMDSSANSPTQEQTHTQTEGQTDTQTDSQSDSSLDIDDEGS